MSSEIAIKVENLGKSYHIYDRPQDRLKQPIYSRLRRVLGKTDNPLFREFWALKNISFEIFKGDTLGIIGINGSGKSTLLQLICGTLNPTEGKISSNGRIAALLELGSGFNPEFTGKENVYLNASLLGLSKIETDRRFKSIIDFAEIGEFIDQPVKLYSSGMMVRLAFAVIAHVDADILVIDEALAVGDAIFTQKCMRFIREFQLKGTLIFVSHDLSSIQNLCQKAIWIHHGDLVKIDKATIIAQDYLQFTQQKLIGNDICLTPIPKVEKVHTFEKSKTIKQDTVVVNYSSMVTIKDNLNASNGWKTGIAEILSVTIVDAETSESKIFEGGDLVKVIIKATSTTSLEKPILGFLFRDRLGQDLFGENTLKQTETTPFKADKDSIFEGIFEFRLPYLPNGQYVIMTSLAEGDYEYNIQHHWLHEAALINVFSSKVRYGLVGVSFSKIKLQKYE
jgi:lipopolysaccharide transport system ATP-binding protein